MLHKSPNSLINMFLVSDIFTFSFRMMHVLHFLLITALLLQNFVNFFVHFLQIFDTGKNYPQNFLLLECMARN